MGILKEQKPKKKHYVEIVSNGLIGTTVIKIDGKEINCCQSIRYKSTMKEQAVTIVYLDNTDGELKLKDGEAVERQYLFYQDSAVFDFDITSIFDKKMKLLVKKNVPQILFGRKIIKGVQEILWQIAVPNETHELEIKLI